MSDLADAERERDEAVTNFEETYADLAETRFLLKEVRSDYATAQQAFAASQAELSLAEALIRAVSAEREVELRDLAHARAELASARQERDTLAAKWEKALAEGDELTVQIVSLRQELQTLRSRDVQAREVPRMVLAALGLDPDAERPLMAARELAAEVAELRAARSHCHCPDIKESRP